MRLQLHSRVAAVIVLGLCLVSASSVSAQSVTGKMLDGVSKTPIMLGRIALVDTTMTIVDVTWTNEAGEFTLRSPQPGSFYVAADRVGYSPKVDGLLMVPADGAVDILFYLTPAPVQLAELTVEARRRLAQDYLADVGFTDRVERNEGWFIAPEDIEKASVTQVLELLRRAPGARIQDLGAASTIVFRTRGNPNPMRQGGGQDPSGFCTPRVFLDGVETTVTFRKGITTGASIDHVGKVRDILGIEVHRGPATLPLMYGGTSTECATLLIWTIHGPRKDAPPAPRSDGTH